MIESQLLLLAATFATAQDFDSLKLIYKCLKQNEDFLSIVCFLTPECTNPELFQFLFDEVDGNIDGNDTLIEVLERHGHLIPLVEMSNEKIYNRLNAVKNYILNEYSRLNVDCEAKFFGDWKSDWLRDRIILCNEHNGCDLIDYNQLWKIVFTTTDFECWLNGILKPLKIYNSRLDISKIMTIRDFEDSDPADILTTVVMALNREHETFGYYMELIDDELIPYLNYSKRISLFIEKYITSEYFKLNTTSCYIVIENLFTKLKSLVTRPDLLELEANILSLFFENCVTLFEITTTKQICELLMQFDPNTSLKDHDLTAETLIYYTKFIEVFSKEYTLSELHHITKENAEKQLSVFSSIIKVTITQFSDPKSQLDLLERMMQFINDSNTGQTKIFTKIKQERKISMLIETLLELGEFDLMLTFVKSSNSTIETSVLEKYFWHFFNNASNGLSSRPEIKKAKQTLNLLLLTDTKTYGHLQTLLDVADVLSHYSLNLGKNLPFKPSNIFDFKHNPTKIICTLLELNKKLYQEVEITYDIMDKLNEGMQLDYSKEKMEYQYKYILVQHISHALVQLDFNFAYQKSKELLSKSDISEFWITVFQVTKYLDPDWIDGEIPTNILFSQLELLSELLNICPINETESVILHWSSLELELSTRDLVHDPLSMCENQSRTSSHQKKLIRDVSNGVTNFLSNALH